MRIGSTLKVARFGDNMRDVAVTEGDKVSAQMQLGFSVSGYGVGDLVKLIGDVDDASVTKLVKEYLDTYQVVPSSEAGGDGIQPYAKERASNWDAGFLDDGGLWCIYHHF